MDLFVAIKQVPDTESKIQICSDGSSIDTSHIKWILNPYDEFAVEEALKLREKLNCLVKVITLGPKARTVETLRTALAMGADEAIAIDAPEDTDHFSTAKALKLAIKKEGNFHYIFTGTLAIDDNMSSVSQMLAEFLNIPHIVVVSQFENQKNTALITRDLEGGEKEILEVKGACVVGATKGLNTPRYASLPGIMKAKKKPLKEYSLSELGVTESDRKISFSHFQLPKEKKPVKFLEGTAQQQADQLVELLKTEDKVL